jgi:Tol biopolymer transport system component
MLGFSDPSDRRLSEALRLHVPSDVTPGPGGLLGLELEFSARSPGRGRVHFGPLIHRLPLDGSALDPGDPNAYRCSWGGVITADGAEAEIATPPVRTRPGFAGELRAWAETGEAELRRAVPHGIELEGYSAHFSAAMPARLNEPVCRLYAETFAADLMLLMDRTDSPGLLVRPRPGRTELCGEFIQGEQLPAAAAFVAGTTRACAAAVHRRSARPLLPPRLAVQLARAVHRYGWYVDHRAFGTDLHADPRRALLPRASGGTISAQSHLELAWAAAQQALADDAAATDLQAADAMVAGSLPLPAEHGQPSGPAHGQLGSSVPFAPGDRALRTAPPPRLWGQARPGFTLRPVAAVWDFTVFEANGPARTAYVCVPRNSLPGFIDRLEEGALDDTIAGYLTLPSHRRILSAHQQTRRVGLYDLMGTPTGLLAPERDPQTGRREPGQRGAKHTLARPGKRNRHQDSRQRTRPRFARPAAVIGAVLTAVLAGAGVAAAVLSQGQGGPDDKPAAPVSFRPSALSFPDVAVNTSATRSLTMTNDSSSPVTATRIRITGPGRHDFSVQHSPGVAHRSGRSIQPAALRPPTCLRRLPPTGTCKITVRFAPLAPGKHTAHLRIYLATHRRPVGIILTGGGTLSTPPATHQVSVTGVRPGSGPAAGGTSVRVFGTGFAAGASVHFGANAATKVSVVSAGELTATSPAGADTVDVTVSTSAGTSPATQADRFTYTAADPNGRIAFSRSDPDRGSDATYTMNPDGSNVQPLLPSFASTSPHWSPDGTEVAVISLLGADCPPSCTGSTVIINPDTGAYRVLAPQGLPAVSTSCSVWSPDATHFACRGENDSKPSVNGIYTIRSSDGGGLTRITNAGGAFDVPIDYSPDGKQIVFGRVGPDRNCTETSALFVVNVDGTGLHQITPPGWCDDAGSWSPDGTEIAFEHNGSLFTVHPDGTGLAKIPLVASSLNGAGDVGWSPDGTKIVFLLSPQSDPETGHEGIATAIADGSNIQQVTISPTFDHQPDWGPHPLTG